MGQLCMSIQHFSLIFPIHYSNAFALTIISINLYIPTHLFHFFIFSQSTFIIIILYPHFPPLTSHMYTRTYIRIIIPRLAPKIIHARTHKLYAENRNYYLEVVVGSEKSRLVIKQKASTHHKFVFSLSAFFCTYRLHIAISFCWSPHFFYF